MSPQAADVPATPPRALGGTRSRHVSERVIEGVLLACAVLGVVTTISIALVLIIESSGFFADVSVWEFLFGTRWAPLIEPRSFGVLPLVCGTFLIVVGSALVAVPIGLASGIYLSEYATPKTRGIVKPTLEILAGIPTIVYGYFALTFITPLIQAVFPSTLVYNAASAAIVVGIMILPMVATICDDAIRAVPASLRHAGHALGSTKLEVTAQVVVPAALSGVIAAFVLAISRAIGETMAVSIAAGNSAKLTLNPLTSIQTMTAYIVQVGLGDAPAGTVEYKTIFAVGVLLFAITLVMNFIANRVLLRFRNRYE